VENLTNSKAPKAANFLRSLNKTQKGFSPDAVAMAAWWPRPERQPLKNKKKIFSTGTEGPSLKNGGYGHSPSVENYKHPYILNI
jgi:hypothetical protein